MKKFIVFLLAFLLVVPSAFCSGEREVNLKTIFLRDSSEVTQSLNEKSTQSPKIVKTSTQSSKTYNKQQENLNEEKIQEMSDDEVVSVIVTTSDEVVEINQANLRALAIMNSENKEQAEIIEAVTQDLTNTKVELEKVKDDNDKKNVELAEKDGKISTLEEKLDNKKSYNYLLLGANYNLQKGYGLSLDFGTKFSNGFMTQIGVEVPKNALNPIDILDKNSYTVSTKIGWSW